MTKEKKELTIKELIESSYKCSRKIISDLKVYLGNDYSIESCCSEVGISVDTFYQWKNKSEEFRMAMNRAENNTLNNANVLVSKEIKNGNVDLAFKYLEKRDNRFSSKNNIDVTTNGENITNNYSEDLKKIVEELKNAK